MSETKFLEEKEYIRKLGDFALREYIYSRDKTACLKRSVPRETMLLQALELARAGPASQLATYHTTPHPDPGLRRSLRNKQLVRSRPVKLSQTEARGIEDLESKPVISSAVKAVQKVQSIKMSSGKMKPKKDLTDRSSPKVKTTPKAHWGGGSSSAIDLSDMMVRPGDLKLSLGPKSSFLSPSLVAAAENLRINPSASDTACSKFVEDPSRHRPHKSYTATVSAQSSLGSDSAALIFPEDRTKHYQLSPVPTVSASHPHISQKHSGKLPLAKSAADRYRDAIPNKETSSGSTLTPYHSRSSQRQPSQPPQSRHHLAASSASTRVSKKHSLKIPSPIRVPTDSLESFPFQAMLQAEAAERKAVDYLKEGNRWDNFISGRTSDGLNPHSSEPGSDLIHLEACLQEETLKREDHLELERIQKCKNFVQEKGPLLLAHLRPRNSLLPRRPPLSLLCHMDGTEHLQLVDTSHERIIIEAFLIHVSPSSLEAEAVERERSETSKQPPTAVSPKNSSNHHEIVNPIVNNHATKSIQAGQDSYGQLLLDTDEMTDHANAAQQINNTYNSSVFRELASLGPIYPENGVRPRLGASPISPKSKPAFVRLLPPSDNQSTPTGTKLSYKADTMESKWSLDPTWTFEKANERLPPVSFGTHSCPPSHSSLPSVDVPPLVEVSSNHECGELTGIYVSAPSSPLLKDLGIELMTLNSPGEPNKILRIVILWSDYIVTMTAS
ncbi:uncharacterized protein MELLADRAFT_66219 [Melampsora larici-populina 98AG31]|uniref:Uncharacterized protein n=1 Tax=Melampsora larici-populina (strain 98AG31 / pathotype 3-4-7) TaxID=747676 RepID=F4RYA9_MELLP|nr:uncharacterized protein MELLADRAFT_66219 [Melampsora larici-populina 98AG31]EGG02668.1 hypothetical protein MELLADRAFT_66219 [Melampsora larici-populina 98AG31]